jgi:hypothetical protein
MVPKRPYADKDPQSRSAAHRGAELHPSRLRRERRYDLRGRRFTLLQRRYSGPNARKILPASQHQLFDARVPRSIP